MRVDDPLDRESNPGLTVFFDALDELVFPPADPALRTAHIQRAALAARAATTDVAAGPWSWRRAASVRVAAVAAATMAIAAGLGADDRLPEPAQRVVSSVADAVGVEVPDGSTRSDAVPDHQHDDDDSDDTSGRSGTTTATRADAGDPGEPATPATSAVPGRIDDETRDTPVADPADPADSNEPSQPATPASPPSSVDRPSTSHPEAERGQRPKKPVEDPHESPSTGDGDDEDE